MLIIPFNYLSFGVTLVFLCHAVLSCRIHIIIVIVSIRTTKRTIKPKQLNPILSPRQLNHILNFAILSPHCSHILIVLNGKVLVVCVSRQLRNKVGVGHLAEVCSVELGVGHVSPPCPLWVMFA